MNAIVLEFPSTIRAEIRALAKAAHTFSRLSVQKRQWAQGAALAGQMDTAAKWHADANRLRVQAADHIAAAMNKKDFWNSAWRYEP